MGKADDDNERVGAATFPFWTEMERVADAEDPGDGDPEAHGVLC